MSSRSPAPVSGVVPTMTMRPGRRRRPHPMMPNPSGNEFSVATPFVPNDGSGAPALVNLATNGTSLAPL